ncbi:TPA: conjugal transfer protein TraM [Legionella pneumophila]|uniref:Conjugal transfer protein TraM n=1 Tax=Legionella pneumophila TaxID=446 RepID=A0AAN5Q2I7_LEGPN|nr:conjugal transfer protein TraM [Legionella pneumophila]HCC3251349.1 conjugal transfer protein TraM [Legionella pneumophila subsp. pneumophila]AMV15212.1 Transcriptional activator TraM [Legionella pneumophila]MBN5929865.1 conjugal transfer protein TraM [Legionella pneumophila]MDF1929935.1 conjugal transfer protein TraM [Legionella pneumophila]PYB44022.1 conjugal transfer protein TraM [Legionella pneumophila]
MSVKINEAIQDIAVKHGVVLGKDDPVLILQTMNERLLEENRKAQQDMLTHFKEEMEDISSQWKDDAKEKAEKVLNAALASSKEAMDKILRETTSEFVHAMKRLISDSLTEARYLTQQTRKTNRFTLLSSGAMLTVSCAFMLLFLIDFLR